MLFPMDIPPAPVQERPVMLAQAASSNRGPSQADFVFEECQQTMPTPSNPNSGFRMMAPVYGLAQELERQTHRNITDNKALMAAFKPVLIERVKHGTLRRVDQDTDYWEYWYAPEPAFIGDDSAVFMVTFEGKRYKVIFTIRVLQVIDRDDQCFDPKLTRVGKQAAG